MSVAHQPGQQAVITTPSLCEFLLSSLHQQKRDRGIRKIQVGKLHHIPCKNPCQRGYPNLVFRTSVSNNHVQRNASHLWDTISGARPAILLPGVIGNSTYEAVHQIRYFLLQQQFISFQCHSKVKLTVVTSGLSNCCCIGSDTLWRRPAREETFTTRPLLRMRGRKCCERC